MNVVIFSTSCLQPESLVVRGGAAPAKRDRCNFACRRGQRCKRHFVCKVFLAPTAGRCWYQLELTVQVKLIIHYNVVRFTSPHLSLNHEGRLGTTADLATSLLHFPLFSTASLGPGELQACPYPDVVFPPLPLSALSSSPFHRALQNGFGQT